MAGEKDIGEELIALCKNCSVRKNIILTLVETPAYVDAIREFKGEINDESLYNIVTEAYSKILAENIVTKQATRGVKGVSKGVTGDAFSWEKSLPDDLKKVVKKRRSQLRFELPSKDLYRIIRNEEVSTAFRKYGVSDDRTAYDVCKLLLFQKIYNGYDHEDQILTGKYFAMRNLVEKYAKALGKDPGEWHCDYQEFLETKTFTIRKASRNGGYEKVTVTEDEVAAMLQHDERLENVDEYL